MSFRALVFAVGIGLIAALGHAQEGIDQPEVQPEASETDTAEKPVENPSPVAPPIIAPANPASSKHDPDAAADGSKQADQYPDIIRGDGWAQWAMAILTLIGVGISGWAVLLLKRTLDATRAAVREAQKATIAAQDATAVTRDIGQSQVRAYMGIDTCKMGINLANSGIVFDITVKNSGNSPCKNLEISACIVFSYDEPGMQSLANGSPIWVGAPLADFASSETRSEQFQFIDVMEQRPNTAPSPILAQVEVVLLYKDVFGRPQSSFSEFIISYRPGVSLYEMNNLTRHRFNIDGREDQRITRHREVQNEKREQADKS